MSHFDRSTSKFIQRGNSSTLTGLDDEKWYLVVEEWEGSRLLDTKPIGGPYDTEKSAMAALLASSSSAKKAASSAANGRKGGRPRKDAR